MIDTSSEDQAQLELDSEMIDSLEVIAHKTIGSVNRRTAEAYRNRVKSLADAIAFDLPNRPYRNVAESDDPLQITNPCHFVDMVLELKRQKRWSSSTWRFSRSALNFIFSDQYCNGKGENKGGYITGLYHAKISTKTERGQKKSRDKTSEKKHITPAEINQIFTHLTNGRSGSIWMKRTAIFVMAGLVTGLRPIEWETALWDTLEKKELRVRTSKIKREATDPRGLESVGQTTRWIDFIPYPEIFDHPSEGSSDSVNEDHGKPAINEKRDLHRIIPIEPYDVHIIDNQIEEIRIHLDQGNDFNSYYNSVRVNLWRCCKEIFGEGNGISLYTMRHQFISNSCLLRGPNKTSMLVGQTIRSPRKFSGTQAVHVFDGQNTSSKQVLSPSEKAAIEFLAIRQRRFGSA